MSSKSQDEQDLAIHPKDDQHPLSNPPRKFSSTFRPHVFTKLNPIPPNPTTPNQETLPSNPVEQEEEHPISDNFRIETDLPPCCLEFVPEPSNDRLAEYLVVGTYFLEKEEEEEEDSSKAPKQNELEKEDPKSEEEVHGQPNAQNRSGSLNLYRVRNDVINLIQNHPYPSGILDLHFIPNSRTFAICTSTGSISIFEITKDYQIHHISTHQIFPTEVLITSFTWFPPTPSLDPSLTNMMSVTNSLGKIHLLTFSNNFDTFTILNDTLPLITHSDRAWCSAFSLPPPSPSPSSSLPTSNRTTTDEEGAAGMKEEKTTLYTGGDDFTLRLTHFPTPLTSLLPTYTGPNPDPCEVFGYPRIHEYGVTALLPLPPFHSHPEEEKWLLTGSYDEYLRLLYFSTPGSRPKKVFEERIRGGGVWRLKFISGPEYTSTEMETGKREVRLRLLTTNMQAGCRVLSISGVIGGTWDVEEETGVRHHKGEICYASDVQPLVDDGEKREGGKEEKRLVVSSAFYEKMIYCFRC